jgi:L-alanine-DL-glutamate epimerase-like enolase superfamily enzyme
MRVTEQDTIAAVGVASVRIKLPKPLKLGDWVMSHRSLAVVAVRAQGGAVGWASSLTREGPVEDMIRRYVTPAYVGKSLADPATIFEATRGMLRPVLGSGTGLRALSLIDIATWDVAARVAGRSLRDHLGGTAETISAMGIVGYPPDPATDVPAQAAQLAEMGISHVKFPIAGGLEQNRERMQAATPYAERISIDGAWTIDDVDDAVRLTEAMPKPGWLEDPVPPHRIDLLAELHRRVHVDVAMGDEQGGPGFPDAMLYADAVDVVRLDATVAGGVSGLRPVVRQIREAGKGLSFHIYGRMHAAIAAAIADEDAIVEWSLPGMLVDPMMESLPAPTFENGRMHVDDLGLGLGEPFDRDWLLEQGPADPDGVLDW